MVDLSKLPQQALAAAMKTGTDGWGRWGSIDHHALYVQELPKTKKGWRLCRCGCRKRRTHAVMANGIAMASGCELSAHRTMRAMNRRRSSP